jgi:soluble lytic murein transglycosylase-like protein
LRLLKIADYRVRLGWAMRAIVALTAVLLTSVPAAAQIYSWRDANGNLVLSGRPPAGQAVHTYAVPKAESVRATRFVAADRATIYDDLIAEHAKLNNVRPDLVRAVMQVESAFNPYARSPKGALGLMQLMPATLQQFGVRNAFNPVENVRAGVAYLRQLLDRYANNEELALAAYNAGPGAVDKHGQTVPPYRETQNYVAQINHMAGRPLQTRGSAIYKITEIVDGVSVTRYSDQKPAHGTYEVVSR